MKAKKSFGQHFLKSEKVIRAIVLAAEVKKGERILEIGPGTGVLTEALVEAGAKVIAVEADRDLIPLLDEKFGKAITLISGDALKEIPPRSLKRRDYKLVSNLPYNVASEILEQYLKTKAHPTRMIIMVQKEVGDRILSKPGEMSVISVATQLYTDGTRVIRVPAGAFNPPPKVESVVLRLDYNKKTKDPEHVIAVAKAGFRSRRKQLHRNLADANVALSENVKTWLLELDLSPKARAQELSTENWIKLVENIDKNKTRRM
ncbi:MAG: 16S rRNA (adenine(1518)-N(6)/adenine(1519)-N(6))-dimethyltransferase RsmA [bacterium]|nr:16S rRNA (adenine(1518)-N(6)/adenine(1519)-N(6))-dimethyltransferase RsmA [bacterium]